MMQAALAGVGFMLTFEGYAAPHIKTGRLITMLDDWQPPFPGPFLYYPSRRHVPAPLRAFIDFVRARPQA
jgi:DNA-binding transcriptional LysR family regulator